MDFHKTVTLKSQTLPGSESLWVPRLPGTPMGVCELQENGLLSISGHIGAERRKVVGLSQGV